MVNRFFVETLGITYDYLVYAIKQRWTGTGSPPFANLERSLVKACHIPPTLMSIN
jgi:hypothetical protein